MVFPLLRRGKDLPLPHVRLIALALLAVLLPAVVLLVLQYRSLCDLERQTRMAVQENLREAAEAVARSIQGDMGRVAQELLLPVPARFFAEKQAPWTAAQIQGLLGECSEIRQVFLVYDPEVRGAGGVAYFYSRQCTRKLSKSEWADCPEVQRAIKAHERADLLVSATTHPAVGSDPRTRDLVFWQDSPMGEGMPGREEAAYVIYCLVEPGTSREVGFVGMQLNMAEVRQRYLPELASVLSRNQKSGSGHPDLILGVLDQNGKQICSSARSAARSEARVSLAPVFPQWEATAGFQGTDIDTLARASFEKGLWFTVLVLAVLLAGIAMIVRAAMRELRLAEAKQTFVSNVSHELKTPLSLIRLFAETLEMGRATTDQKAHEYYHIIHNESRRLSQLIDNILNFSRIEAGSREYNMVPADLGEVARAVVESYEYQIRTAGFELVASFDPMLPSVQADPEAISQAILNLLNNAVKYSDGTKHVAISVQAKEGGASVQVADRGIGIPLCEQKRIFEKFYRVCTGLRHETKGSGLGLALVKHIVEAHQGRVSVESAPGKGSCFTLWLPASRELTRQTGPASGGKLVAQSLDH